MKNEYDANRELNRDTAYTPYQLRQMDMSRRATQRAANALLRKQALENLGLGIIGFLVLFVASGFMALAVS